MTVSQGIEALYSESAAELLQREQGLSPPAEYLNQIIRAWNHTGLYQRVKMDAQEVEPYDRIAGQFNPEGPYANALFYGSLPGVRIAYRFLSPDQITAAATFKTGIDVSYNPKDPHFADIQDASHASHMEIARVGWYLAEPALGQLFDEWADRLGVSADTQPYFKGGLGYVFYLAREADIETNRQQLEQLAVAGGGDWDAAFEAELMVEE